LNAPEPRPLFHSVDQAIQWTFYGVVLDGQTVGGAGFVRMMKRDEREQIDGEEMRPMRTIHSYQLDTRPKHFDAAGQAGMIKSLLMTLCTEDRAHLYVRCLRGRERAAAKRDLLRYLEHQILDQNPRLMLELVGRFYGKRVALRALGRTHNMTRHKLDVLWRRAFVALDALAERVDRAVYERLQRDGVVA